MTLIRSGTISGDVPLRINTPEKERMMAELRVYTVTMGRNITTMQLSEQGVQEMKALGYGVEPVAEKAVADKAAEPVLDKARRARNK